MGDDLWYPTMRSPPLPLLRAHPAATANLSARSLEGFVRDHQTPDFLKARKQPVRVKYVGRYTREFGCPKFVVGEQRHDSPGWGVPGTDLCVPAV